MERDGDDDRDASIMGGEIESRSECVCEQQRIQVYIKMAEEGDQEEQSRGVVVVRSWLGRSHCRKRQEAWDGASSKSTREKAKGERRKAEAG